MAKYIVTRHQGAIEWLRRHGGADGATVLRHVDGETFGPGDQVLGVLPIALAARVCAAGGEAHVLTYDVPEHTRGQELSAGTLTTLGARLVRYDVREVGHEASDPNTAPHA